MVCFILGSKMIKLELDLSKLRNEISIIENESFLALQKDDKNKREVLGRIVEKLRKIKQELDCCVTEIV